MARGDNLTFFEPVERVSFPQTTQRHHSGVPRRGPPNITIRAIDLAGYMNRVLPSIRRQRKRWLFSSLTSNRPSLRSNTYLIATGALCRVHLLLIEWRECAASSTSFGLGLRLTLSSMLRQGYALNKHAIWTDGLVGPQMIHEGPVNSMSKSCRPLGSRLHHNGTPVPGQTPSRLVSNGRIALPLNVAHLKSTACRSPPGVLGSE